MSAALVLSAMVLCGLVAFLLPKAAVWVAERVYGETYVSDSELRDVAIVLAIIGFGIVGPLVANAANVALEAR